jgi:hypothetical protein
MLKPKVRAQRLARWFVAPELSQQMSERVPRGRDPVGA